MVKKSKKTEAQEEEVLAEEAETSTEEPTPADPLEEAERERDEMRQNWQRARADFQNLKRRILEDIEAAVGRERSAVLEGVLTILDYLDMALASPCESPDAKNLLVGVQMTRDQLWSMLEQQSVKPIDAEGDFDPARHQAVSTVETDQSPPGSIVELVRSGYTISDKVLRYAQVKVAAAPEASSEEEEAPGED